MLYDLAISPCPNDTYIFYNFIQNGPFRGLPVHFADVEELNIRAVSESRHTIAKLSFAAILHLQETGAYRLLDTGAALGRGCGPILISSWKGMSLTEILKQSKTPEILIPGSWTTANLLTVLYLSGLGLPLSDFIIRPLRYDLILKRMQETPSLGVIIHEERFTYGRLGFDTLQDLGDWWEGSTGLPIPLGGITVRSDVSGKDQDRIESSIKESIDAARKNPEGLMPFIRSHAQSLEDSVIRSHIELYVNEFSLSLGKEGEMAVKALSDRIREAGIRRDNSGRIL